VSIIDDFNFGDIESLRSKYGLPKEYYIISNQFHKHKNHRVVLRALAELKDHDVSVHLVITGKMPSTDNPYIRDLYDIISRHSLDNHVSFLGVIPRQDQLNLMQHAKAVIQPSLFEGWSTVIEDAKSLQVPVIAAHLDVNVEQLGAAGIYFDPHDEEKLADILSSYKTNGRTPLYEDYNKRVKKFAEQFIQLFREQQK
jgi:glycosyltransferase involved in cell wall biosynthesis